MCAFSRICQLDLERDGVEGGVLIPRSQQVTRPHELAGHAPGERHVASQQAVDDQQADQRVAAVITARRIPVALGDLLHLGQCVARGHGEHLRWERGSQVGVGFQDTHDVSHLTFLFPRPVYCNPRVEVWRNLLSVWGHVSVQ